MFYSIGRICRPCIILTIKIIESMPSIAGYLRYLGKANVSISILSDLLEITK
jgi:hypothetical protein